MKATVELKSDWRYPVESNFVRDTSLSVEARLLYILIKSYVGPNCALPFPSLDTLAKHMDRHRESIQKYLTELESAGYLNRRRVKEAGRFCSTRYEIFETREAHRRGKKPLRKFPTTEISSTKGYQLKDKGRSALVAPPPDATCAPPTIEEPPANAPKAEEGAWDDNLSAKEIAGHSKRHSKERREEAEAREKKHRDRIAKWERPASDPYK